MKTFPLIAFGFLFVISFFTWQVNGKTEVEISKKPIYEITWWESGGFTGIRFTRQLSASRLVTDPENIEKNPISKIGKREFKKIQKSCSALISEKKEISTMEGNLMRHIELTLNGEILHQYTWIAGSENTLPRSLLPLWEQLQKIQF